MSSTVKKKANLVPTERRVDFSRWRGTVEGRFDAQDDILKEQASTLKNIDKKLDTHIQATQEWKREQLEITNNWKEELRPVIETHQSMQQGVRVIGKVGSFVGWLGNKIVQISAVVLAAVGMILAWKNWPR